MNYNEESCSLTAEEANGEVKRCLKCQRPLCKINGCPAHLPINVMMAMVQAGQTAEAYRLIRRETNLPLICSRVCDYDVLCRHACVLNLKNAPITPGYIERYIADREAGKNEPFPGIHYPFKVAVIGSGPAGLSCALELAQNGVRATVYEREEHIGGVLSYGIPEYRLPIAVLERQIEIARRAGIAFVLGWKADYRDLANFDHIVYATGLTSAVSMEIPGENLEGVFKGGTFLKKNNYQIKYGEGDLTDLGSVTVVVGAGNVAMDCARLAVRIGQKVIVVYRRTEMEAPAAKSEIAAAKKEGVELRFLQNPVELIGFGGKLTAVKIEKMKLGEADESGRARPLPTGIFEIIKADSFIEAIGQKSETDLAAALGLAVEHGLVKVAEDFTATPNISAIGDIVNGAKTVVRAMVDGKAAAANILAKVK